jgi:tetratricopeptide (TPR) repeat protein
MLCLVFHFVLRTWPVNWNSHVRFLPGYIGRLIALGICFIVIALLFFPGPCTAAGQKDSSHTANASVVEAHFAAAEQAQKNNDYVTAVREYRAVLELRPDFAEVHMNLGLVYQLEGQISDAMIEFQRALHLKPALAGANFLLGVDYCKNGDGTRALPYLKAAAKQDPQRTDIWSWLATAEEMSGELHAEVATLQKALDFEPRNVDLLYLLGQAYERLGKEEVARLQKTAPHSTRSEQLLAESYAASSEWPSAVIHFQNSLAASPDTRGLHVELGEVLLRAGKLTRAVHEFEEELHLTPNSLRAIVRRGETKLILGDVEGSLQDWNTAMAKDDLQAERVLGIRESGLGAAAFEQIPDAQREEIEKLAPEFERRDTPPAHLALAFLAMQSGNSSSQVSEGERALSSREAVPSPMNCSEAKIQQALFEEQFSALAHCAPQVLAFRPSAKSSYAFARALFEAGDCEASLKLLSELAPADQHSQEASYWRARCYENLATASYLRLFQADPNSYRLHQLTGDLNAAKGNDGKAIEEYRLALALKPSLPNLHYSLGHLLWKDLKVSEARQELEAELALNPRHAGALNDLGNTYLLEHEPAKALPLLSRAFRANPQNPDIHRDLGTAYSELHDYPKAEAEFKIAVASDHDGSVHYKLARVYQALGQKEEASREFELSTALNAETHRKLEKQRERLDEVEKSTQEP